MPEKRRKFSPEFRDEAVQEVLTSGRAIADIARSLGIHEGTLGNWVKLHRDKNPEVVHRLQMTLDAPPYDLPPAAGPGSSGTPPPQPKEKSHEPIHPS